MKKYALKIAEAECWGCKACEVACKQEHKTSVDINFIKIIEEWGKKEDGSPDFIFRARICRHCENPACVDACPAEAIRKRDDGIVILDSDVCTGCGSCIEACPYNAISLDESQGKAKKCNMCYHRVDNGLIPACADNVCLAHCIYFGDARKIDKMIEEKFWLKARIEGKLSSQIIRVED